MTKLRSIELRKFRNQTISKWGRTYPISYGVYFDERVDRLNGNSLLNHEPYHCIIHDWLRANCVEEFGAHFVMASYVFFRDEDEAILCHMAFSGSGNS